MNFTILYLQVSTFRPCPQTETTSMCTELCNRIRCRTHWHAASMPFVYFYHCIHYCNCFGRFKHFWGHWNHSNRPNARDTLLFLIVWCWDTPSAVEFSGSTVTRSPRKLFTAVTGWTLSWFVRPASRLEPSWSRLILSGMLEFCPFLACANTDTWMKSLDCALVSTLETYDNPENGDNCHYYYIGGISLDWQHWLKRIFGMHSICR